MQQCWMSLLRMAYDGLDPSLCPSSLADPPPPVSNKCLVQRILPLGLYVLGT